MRTPQIREVKMNIYFNKVCRTTGQPFGKGTLSMPRVAYLHSPNASVLNVKTEP